VIAKLEKALAQTLAMPDVQKRFADLGAVLKPLNSEQFTKYMDQEMAKWADVVKKAGIQPM
jgi:tripartite-type tricarboxylate transporter receptor subunit TctC